MIEIPSLGSVFFGLLTINRVCRIFQYRSKHWI